MTSIFSRFLSIFTGGSAAPAETKPVAEPQSYEDCVILAEPIKEGGQYRLAGRIQKAVDDKVLERRFIRADVFSSLDDAVDCTFRKAKQIIDQTGAGLFSDGADDRQV